LARSEYWSVNRPFRRMKNSTSKRISRLNPESEWHRADVPHLAIIDLKDFSLRQALLMNSCTPTSRYCPIKSLASETVPAKPWKRSACRRSRLAASPAASRASSSDVVLLRSISA